MTRLTHLVNPLNSAESNFVLSFTTKIPSLRLRVAQNTCTLAPLIHFSPSQNPKITISATALDRRKPHSPHPAMDPNAPAAEVEDFVHIENPSVDDTLSESIVSVELPQIDDGGGDAYDDVVSTSNDAEDSEQRKVLPVELSRSVVTLTCESATEGGVCDVYLVGTAHVSQVNWLDWFLFGCRENSQLFSVWLVRKFPYSFSKRTLKEYMISVLYSFLVRLIFAIIRFLAVKYIVFVITFIYALLL